MSAIAFEFHPEQIFLLPLLAIEHGTCENPECTESHWHVSVGWLVGSVSFYF